MLKIKKLSPQEAQKIAAGEVVERPSNVVKELLENAIDAGASQISLYIENGGKDLIKVVDNGSGMSLEDALMSIEHHATSKISKVEDLESLTTFGFRGEALSSISSVSLMTIKTKTADQELGNLLTIEWGKVISTVSISCNTGTEITIKNIFENVPARKKFLKTKETETRAIMQLFYAAALSYININFKLYNENKLVYNCPQVDNIKSRISQILDSQISENIITSEIYDSKNNLKIYCALTISNYSRYDKNYMFYFVNSRWVKNYKLAQATLKGYMNMLPDGKFPAAFVFIELDPKVIDVNIHPRKDEILFLNPKIVESAIENCVKSGLEKFLNSKIDSKFMPSFKEPESLTNTIELGENLELKTKHFSTISSSDLKSYNKSEKFAEYIQTQSGPALSSEKEWKDIKKSIENDKNIIPEVFQNSSLIQEISSYKQYNKDKDTNIINKYKIIGQLSKTYIILQTADGMMLIDQHAAHERILYEKFTTKFNELEKINLIAPLIINLQDLDISIVLEFNDIFKEYGIELEQFGSNKIVIKSAPVILQKESLEEIVKFILNILKETGLTDTQNIKTKINERVHAQMACKAAVKSGDVLGEIQMQSLVDELYTTANRITCPHGRPTFWHLNIDEINKKFKRPNITSSI